MQDGEVTGDSIRNSETRPGSRLFGLASAILLIVVFLVRTRDEIVHIDQPIFEGYVGRQVPTAMVARDLSRDGSFLYPRLQTGPFPSWFLIEPPVYAQVSAWIEQFSDFPLERCGRILSLAAMLIGAAAIGDLTRRRSGLTAAGWAIVFFVAWPVTCRYARAFQPDMFALGLLLAGIAFRRRADESLAAGREDDIFPTLAWASLAIAFASKPTLAPLAIGMAYPRIPGKPNHSNLRFLASTLVPTVCWYAWAAWLTFSSPGHSAGHSLDGFAFWLNAPGPISLLSVTNLEAIARNVLAKAWTPVGVFLWLLVPVLWRRDPAVRRWVIALACWFAIVGGKAHHGYYWLVPSPFLAILGGWFMARIDAEHGASTFLFRVSARHLGFVGGTLMAALSILMAADTYVTPEEWKPLTGEISRIRAWLNSTPGRPFVGHEAAIFALDRPGFRWEWSEPAQRRAAAAFGTKLEGESPAALLEFYRSQGAAWFVAIETDPEWERQGRALGAILDERRIVQRSGRLVLYSLTEPSAPHERP
ncbi:hypothetical protein GC170_09450 [bacterium]|nr:hypothetical protein [bacterium]